MNSPRLQLPAAGDVDRFHECEVRFGVEKMKFHLWKLPPYISPHTQVAVADGESGVYICFYGVRFDLFCCGHVYLIHMIRFRALNISSTIFIFAKPCCNDLPEYFATYCSIADILKQLVS